MVPVLRVRWLDENWLADHGALPSNCLNIIRMRVKVDLRMVLPVIGNSGPSSYSSRTWAATQLHQTGHSRSAQHLERSKGNSAWPRRPSLPVQHALRRYGNFRAANVLIDGRKFGSLVKRRRGVESLTQQQLAVLAFGDEGRKARISELENGRVPNPQSKTVDALLVSLNFSEK